MAEKMAENELEKIEENYYKARSRIIRTGVIPTFIMGVFSLFNYATACKNYNASPYAEAVNVAIASGVDIDNPDTDPSTKSKIREYRVWNRMSVRPFQDNAFIGLGGMAGGFLGTSAGLYLNKRLKKKRINDFLDGSEDSDARAK